MNLAPRNLVNKVASAIRAPFWDTYSPKLARTVSLIQQWKSHLLFLIETTYLHLAQRSYGQNGVIYGCLKLLAQSIPEPTLRAYRVDADGNQVELPEDHPLVRLMRRPNPLMTEYEEWELTAIHSNIRGHSFWWKERDRLGNILALWPLRPDRVGPIYANNEDEEAYGQRVIVGWSYFIPGTGRFLPIPAEDMMVFNLPDPAGETGGIVEGLGPVQVVAREVAADNEATNFVGALVSNYAMPGIVLQMKAQVQDESEAERIKYDFMSQFGGSKRGEPAIVDAETTVQSLGFNLQQLEFAALRRMTESRICATFGTPPILVHLMVGLEHGTENNYQNAREFFTETTCASFWRRFRDQYQNDIVVEFGDDLVVEWDLSQVKALAGQRQRAIQPVADAFKAGGATRNQYMEKLGLPLFPPEVGDVFLIPSGVTIVSATAPLQLPPPADSSQGQEETEQPTDAESQHDQEIDVEEEGDDPIADETRSYSQGIRAVAFKDDDERERIENELRDKLANLFGVLSNQVAEKIRNHQAVTDEELEEAFNALFFTELVQIVSDEVTRISVEIGVQFDPAVINQDAVDWAKGHLSTVLPDLTATTQKTIQNAVSQYHATPGMTVEDLKNQLTPALGDTRAEVVSITEITNAASGAAFLYQARLEESGVSMELYWATDKDDAVCPICSVLDGKPQSEWIEKYPHGPAAHVRCRCATFLRVPETKEQAA